MSASGRVAGYDSAGSGSETERCFKAMNVFIPSERLASVQRLFNRDRGYRDELCQAQFFRTQQRQGAAKGKPGSEPARQSPDRLRKLGWLH